MKNFALSTIAGLAALLPHVQQSLAVSTWDLSFYDGEMCTGEFIGERRGPRKPKAGSYCADIPAPGDTSTALLQIAKDQGYSYFVQTYYYKGCGGGVEGTYDGNPGGRVCFNTNGEKSFKVTTVKGTKRPNAEDADESALALNPNVTDSTEAIDAIGENQASSSSTQELEARQTSHNQYNLAYLLTGLGGAYAGLIGIGNNCPFVKDEDKAVNSFKCTVHGIYGALSGAFAAYQAEGLRRYGINKRDNSSIGSLGLPYQNTTLVPGQNITFTLLEPWLDTTGDAWDQYAFNAIDMDSNTPIDAVVRLHPDGRGHVQSEIGDSADPPNVRKRASGDNYSAYYSWANGNKANYQASKHDASSIKSAAIASFNYGRRSRHYEWCDDLYDAGTSPRRYIYQGSQAVTSGTFNDQSENCQKS